MFEAIGFPLGYLYKNNRPPGYPVRGTLWLDSELGDLMVYDGDKWIRVGKMLVGSMSLGDAIKEYIDNRVVEAVEEKLVWNEISW